MPWQIVQLFMMMTIIIFVFLIEVYLQLLLYILFRLYGTMPRVTGVNIHTSLRVNRHCICITCLQPLTFWLMEALERMARMTCYGEKLSFVHHMGVVFDYTVDSGERLTLFSR